MLAHDSCHVVWGISKISKTVKYGSCCYFGDTGGASGFLGVKGVEVIILYPSGKVSDIQERQLTTGQNINT
jgi:threonine synthase